MKEKIISEKTLRTKTITAFLLFFLAMLAAFLLWKKLSKEPQDAGIGNTLRGGLLADERIFSSLFNKNTLVKTYPKSAAVKQVRVNGDYGLRDETINTSTWRLKLVKSNGDTLFISLNDIKKLPKQEVVFDFKCIEGWSQKTWWGGARFVDFIKAYHLEKEASLNYVGLVTPDKEYYVGIDEPSMLQPQTILCYEMNGVPLPLKQGYPLRLIIPVKYGIKHLKRIGTIFFSDQKPPDYWAERGYDYYSGH